MEPAQGFTSDEASRIADLLALDSKEAFDLEQFRMGLGVELEHGRREPATNVTNDDPVVTGKIALAHLRELPDYRRSIKSSTVDSMRIRHLLSRPPAPEESAHEQPHCGR